MGGADLVVEYVGGPKDGELAILLRTSPLVPKGYPKVIRHVERDGDGKEFLIGHYVRHNMRIDERAMRYIWAWSRS
jgi:hypothetical protein